MADPVTIATVAATAISAGGSIVKGMGAASGDNYLAQQSELQAQYGQIKAAQTNTMMEENLQRTLSNITAVQSATGARTSSPSDQAYRNYSEFLGDRDRTQAVANINAQVQQDQSAQAYYQSAASNALLGGFLGAAGSIAGSAGGFLKANPGFFNGGNAGYSGGSGIGMA